MNVIFKTRGRQYTAITILAIYSESLVLLALNQLIGFILCMECACMTLAPGEIFTNKYINIAIDTFIFEGERVICTGLKVNIQRCLRSDGEDRGRHGLELTDFTKFDHPYNLIAAYKHINIL